RHSSRHFPQSGDRMNRRSFINGSLAATAGTGMPVAMQAQSAVPKTTDLPGQRPNVIWLFADQHRAQALGCMGDPNAYTPTIDTCSVFGSHFVNAVGGFPLCCPYRG